MNAGCQASITAAQERDMESGLLGCWYKWREGADGGGGQEPKSIEFWWRMRYRRLTEEKGQA